MLSEEITQRDLWFNVAWDLWREVAEIGAFLIPLFLNDEGADAIPLSGIVGLLIGLLCGALIYGVSMVLKDKWRLCIFLVIITGWLSMGLFTGGCHEIEEVTGETHYAWKIEGDVWSKRNSQWHLSNRLDTQTAPPFFGWYVFPCGQSL